VSRAPDVEATPIAGVLLLRRQRHDDERGTLDRLADAEVLAAVGSDFPIMAVNLTVSHRRGTLKGLHAQRSPHLEGKVVTCLSGSVFDVAVDLRAGSPTFGSWFGITLMAEDGLAVVLPRGVAHGIQSLTDGAVVHYVHSAAYAPSAEVGVDALDPEIAIAWPLPPESRSARDRGLPPLRAIDPLLP